MILNNKKLICIPLFTRARAHAMRIYPNVCVCVGVCVCVCVYICVCARDATASPYRFFCRCNCAICYMLDEAIYIYMYRCDRFTYTLHLAWLPLIRPGSHSRVIKTLLFIRICTYTAAAPHTTVYQIRTA